VDPKRQPTKDYYSGKTKKEEKSHKMAVIAGQKLGQGAGTKKTRQAKVEHESS